MVRFLYSCAA